VSKEKGGGEIRELTKGKKWGWIARLKRTWMVDAGGGPVSSREKVRAPKTKKKGERGNPASVG